MKTEAKLMDELEEDYILFVMGQQNIRCDAPAREHAAGLRQRAMVAFIAGCIDDAIWYATRESEFNLRALGARHHATLLSLRHLDALRDYARTASENGVEQAA
jgi:hypothetical protein